jgi:hypothetical protein
MRFAPGLSRGLNFLYVRFVPLPVFRYWTTKWSIRLRWVARTRSLTRFPRRDFLLTSSGLFSFALKLTCAGPGGAGRFASGGRGLRSYSQSTRLQNRM